MTDRFLSNAGRIFAAAAVLIVSTPARSQGVASPKARATAPVNLTGYWVSVISEDWRWRMVTPPKGDIIGVPLNPAGQKLAMEWDPVADHASNDQCKAYGAAALMRLPTRLHITWADDNTLKVETDFGEQTRLLHFGGVGDRGTRSWQGFSSAEWVDVAPPGPPRNGGGVATTPGQPKTATERPGGLKVVTTNLRAQYLRMNGIPVSENATVTDYYDTVPGVVEGDTWLTVKTIVDDPTYLRIPYTTSAHFKQEADASKWHPTPCETFPPQKTAKSTQ